jgi:hypothetical protein
MAVIMRTPSLERRSAGLRPKPQPESYASASGLGIPDQSHLFSKSNDSDIGGVTPP